MTYDIPESIKEEAVDRNARKQQQQLNFFPVRGIAFSSSSSRERERERERDVFAGKDAIMYGAISHFRDFHICSVYDVVLYVRTLRHTHGHVGKVASSRKLFLFL